MENGIWVRSVDIKQHEYGAKPSEFIQGDLTNQNFANDVLNLSNNEVFDEIYQLAADMGGAGYIFTGDNDANVMHNSASINLNILNSLNNIQHRLNNKKTKIFYSSSACIYPEDKQLNVANPGLRESDAYPANPDSEYGWEKLFSERLFMAYSRNHGLDVRIARFHNIFGPEGTWTGGREKAPAAICRKVAQAKDSDTIEIWGDGNQTRSFLFVEDCIDAVLKLMNSEFKQPLNIGSEEMVSIKDLVNLAASFEDKKITLRHIPGPVGVRGRNSNNELIRKTLEWENKFNLESGLRKTYFWIKQQISAPSRL